MDKRALFTGLTDGCEDYREDDGADQEIGSHFCEIWYFLTIKWSHKKVGQG